MTNMQGTIPLDPLQVQVTPDSGIAPNRNHAWRQMTRTVAHYERIEQIGEGTYGQVYRAKCLDTGRIVALKKTRIMSSKGYAYGMPLQLIREIKILKQLRHPNLLQLIEVVTSKGVEHLDHDDPPTTGEAARSAKRSKGKSDDEIMNDDAATTAREKYKGNLFLVLEYVSHDLTGLLDIAYQFTEVQIKSIIQQLLRALAFMHQHKMVHRDIKSSNILIDSRFRLKLADFGLARSLEPPLLDQMDPNGAGNSMQDISYKVITLWYRPPEILLGAVHYDCKVDIWSAGCILAELLGNKPLMPGKSELDQLSMVADVVGTPSKDTWDHLMSLKKTSRMLDELGNVNSKAHELQSSEPQPSKLRNKFRRRKPSDVTFNILEKMLEWDPRKRITAESALQNRFFWTQPVPPENPEELGRIEVAEDGHFHEFQTKQKRREAKAIADGKRDEALRNGMSKTEAEAVYDEHYQDIMKKVAQEGIVNNKEKENTDRERSSERRSESRRRRDPSEESDSRKHRSRKKHRKERETEDDSAYNEKRSSRRRSNEERRDSRDRKERRGHLDEEFDDVVDEGERHRDRDRSRESKKSKKKDSKRERRHKSRDRDDRRRRHRDDDNFYPEPEYAYRRDDRPRSPLDIGPDGRQRRDGRPIDDRYGPPFPYRDPTREPNPRDVPFDHRLPPEGNHYGPSDRSRRQDSPPRDSSRGPGSRGPNRRDTAEPRRRGPNFDDRSRNDDRRDPYRGSRRMDDPGPERYERNRDRDDRQFHGDREPHPAMMDRHRDREDYRGRDLPYGREFDRPRNDGPPPDFRARGRDGDGFPRDRRDGRDRPRRESPPRDYRRDGEPRNRGWRGR